MNFIDRFLCEVDTGLRTLFAAPHAQRPFPAAAAAATAAVQPEQAAAAACEESIRLMRVNHAGEVCAQALYQGQALVARRPATRDLLIEAAQEERDHLAWCDQRLKELGGQTSRLNPIFYAGSFALGVASGLAGDKWSMGFLVETERQVEAHLGSHLERLPAEDQGSRKVIEAMREDEIRHGASGKKQGAAPLPPPVKSMMTAFSRVMTRSTYYV